MNPSSYLSLEIVGVDIAITSILLFGVRRALMTAGHSSIQVRRTLITLGGLLFAWLALTLFLGASGLFQSAVSQPFPFISLAIVLPVLLGALWIRGSRQVQKIIEAVPQSWLVGIQFYRVVGVIFLLFYTAGQLPAVFALPAGVGDVLVGITALVVAFLTARHHSRSDQLIALWNCLGIADLVIAVATGFLSAPSRFQIFSLAAPNTLIGTFPLVMIPIYAVPLSVILHLASLSKLRQNQFRPAERLGHSDFRNSNPV
jgi:hypothetical protein